MATHDWDPDRYLRFAELRARPFWDLVDLVDRSEPIARLVDLGCGTGDLTAALAERLEIGSTIGVDSSPAMLQQARSRQAARGAGRRLDTAISFEAGDIAGWTSDEPVDLIIANASLQWVPDHRGVVARWVEQLAPGGQIAIQVPANADHASHTCSVAVARREPFRSAFGPVGPPPDPVDANVLPPEEYAELLFELGLVDLDVRLHVYPQVMESSSQVVDWVRGTSLTRFFATMPDELHEPFVDAYRHELLAAIGDHTPYFYAFKRILMHATLPT